MTTVTDDADLAELGYRQSLERSVGRFGSFAAGVSYISILTGTFQLFYFGFGSGGPAYWWSWPLVFAGQLMVALCFAELARATRTPARSTMVQAARQRHDVVARPG
jgi:amino acid transporter